MKNIYISFKYIILLATILLSGCYETTDKNVKKKIPQIDLVELEKDMGRLGVNDIIEIKVYDEPELSRVFRIDSSGKIMFPLIGEVKVFNRLTIDVSKEIEKRLKEKYLKYPQVTIFVKETNSKKVYILGQVKKPGSFPYFSKMTILQLIATGGGLTQTANKDGVILKRVIDNKTHTLTISIGKIINGKIKDPILLPNDIVYIPESWL